MFSFPSFVAHCSAALLFHGSARAAADWTYVDSNAERASLVPASVFADSTGILVQGALDGIPYSWLVARYDNSLNLQWVRSDWFNTHGTLAALPDGGFITLGYAVTRLDRNGGKVWAQGFSGETTLIGTDADSGMWLRDSNELIRVASDGTFVEFPWQVPLGAGAVDPANATLFIVRPAALTNVLVPMAILRYDRQGVQTTLWQTLDLSFNVQFVTLGEQKNLYAEGNDTSGLYALSLSPDGAIRWEHHYPNGAQLLIAHAAFADGAMVTLDQAGKLYRIANDGTLAFMLQVGSGPACVAPCSAQIRTTPNGDAIVLISGAQAELVRVDVAGHIVSSQTWTGSTSSDFALLADGSVLVAASPMLHVDRAGKPLPLPLPSVENIVDVGTTLLPTYANRPVIAQSTDGSLYFFSMSNASRITWLSKLSPSGTLLWKQQIEGLSPSNLTLGGGLACWDAGGAIECHATDSGQLAFVNTTRRSLGQLVFLDDGSILAHTYRFGTSDALLALDKSGAVIRNVGLGHEFGGSSAMGSSGTLVASEPGTSATASAWDRYGKLLYTLPAPQGSSSGDSYTILGVDSDGSALFNSLTYLWLLSPAGATRWTQPLSGYPSFEFDRFANGDAFLWGVDFSVYPVAPSHLERRAMSDGKLVRHVDLPPSRYPLSQIRATARLDPSGALIIYSDPGPFANVASVLSSDDAHLIRRLIEPASVSPYSYGPDFIAMSGDGTLRTVLNASGPVVAGPSVRVHATANANVPATTVRIDQPGLDGAWYPTYEGGQGFTFEYIASASTVFMPWFTFSQNAVTDPSGLSWYTLQGGGIAPGATSADLVIAVSNPGAFASSSVAGKQVGTAHLAFTDCSNGLLDYQFNADTNSGASGAIKLTRLTPSTAPCQLAGNVTVPAQSPNAAANGFDARQGGSWYDPATGGQGLELTIIPAGGGSNGVVFAAWFTFDPAGQSDDPAHQHWFTLQGDLANATNSKVTLPIYRIIGGSFDGTPTQNFSQVGRATLTMLACDKAQLDYQFDTSEVTHAFASLAGTSHLIKIGGCSP